ncbi:hypothetical protein [Sphingomonas aracearum]|uniref:Uncharacterized protein n=1 Tax=Sphingomonas aracearum TaxID=2283317 RepID=A0A369VW09_9SPHN|nr:hypothetical protein [Sphingomonas aracearum]RDE06528.1 hypothetical protein DVW87_02120 [Sphingomonas aracearum]
MLHPYSLAVQRPWYVSGDGIHETALGFNVLRREIVRTIIGRIINGAYPAKPFEALLVEKAEATAYFGDKQAALNALSALPDTSYRTVMLARVNAVAAPIDQVQIALGSTASRTTPNWNVVPTAATAGSSLSSLTRVDGAVAVGVSVLVTGAGTSVSASGGTDTGYDSGPVPDDISVQSVRADTGVTWSIEITVPGSGYTVEALSNQVGTFATRTAAISVNGSTRTRNPSDNLVVDTWTGIAPIGGKITVTLTTAAGSSRSYLSMIRLTRTQ